MTFYQYKKQQAFLIQGEGTREELLAREKAQYLTFAAQIELLGALINAEPAQQGDVLWDPLVGDLVVIVSHARTDPVILTSVCYLIH